MKSTIVLTLLAMFAARLMEAQSTCPAILFQQGQTDGSLSVGDNRSVLARQPDGSLTEISYTVDSPTVATTHKVTKTGTVSNYQTLTACAGLPVRTRKPGPGNLKVDTLGVSKNDYPFTTDLAGDGIGVLLGRWYGKVGDQLIVLKGGSDYSITAATGYPVGTRPATVLTGDFNGDGKKDVAVVYTGDFSGPGGVSILLGNGDGTLKPAVNYPTGANALIATAFDFNGDGRPDLAVYHYGAALNILLSNPDGTLKAVASYTFGQTSLSSVAAGDINGDGKADLLVFQAGTGIIPLLGKGDGTFAQTTPIPLNGVSFGFVGVGDVNKDGIPDIITAAPAAGVYVMLGTGGGKFSSPGVFANPGVDTAFFVTDYDGDGNPDLVFSLGHPDTLTPSEDSSNISVLFGNGDGTFQAPFLAQIDGNPNDQLYQGTRIVIGDVNGDGKADIITASPTGNDLAVMLGNGNGIFKTPVTITLAAGVTPNAIALGDLNGDGKPDIIVTDAKNNNVLFLLNKGDGTFLAPLTQPVSVALPRHIITGDFNNDKKLDVAVVNGGNSVTLFLGNGDGSFKTPVFVNGFSNPNYGVAGDFNGDGNLDLAVASSGSAGGGTGNIAILLGRGDGTFQSPVTYSPLQYPGYVTAADINGDKKLDLVIASTTALGNTQLGVMLNKGDGTFTASTPMATSFGPQWVTVGDFNGDGKPDIIVSHCCGTGPTTTFLVGNGNGTFQTETAFGGATFANAAADLDGDGRLDLVTASFLLGGPHVVTALMNVTPAPVPPTGTLVLTSAAGTPLKAPPIAPYSIATAKGADLATGIQVNTNLTPPINMLNTTVNVKDSQGTTRPAQLFYVSPVQVNFLIPQGTATGNATITITSGDGFVSIGTVAIVPIAPSIFTLNSNALAAAYVQRVHGDGTQSIENLYAVDAAGNVTFPPIDLGPATDQVYINIFGTGIQGRSALAGVVSTVGGASAQVFYAGSSTYPGEDQVTVLVPHTLTGAGTVNINMTVDGNSANVTTLNIK